MIYSASSFTGTAQMIPALSKRKNSTTEAYPPMKQSDTAQRTQKFTIGASTWSEPK